MARDEQQAQLLNILRRRRGQPVAYGELQAAGIEFPAGVVAELELAGVEIERCQTAGPGERPVKAVRLRPPGGGPAEEPPARAPAPRVPAGPAADWSEVRLYRASGQSGRQDQELGSPESGPMAALSPAIVAPVVSRRRPRHGLRARVLVLLALLLAVAAIVFVVLSGTAGGHHNPPRSAPHHRHVRRHARGSGGNGVSARSSASSTRTPGARGHGAVATQLQRARQGSAGSLSS